MRVKLKTLETKYFLLKLMVCSFVYLFLPLTLKAQENPNPQALPKLEIGVAFGYFHLPDYPGSDESRSRTLGLPSIVYRGEVILADREGWRGRFLKSDFYEIDLSFGASFPARSEDNEARVGMPDLDWVGEVGPRLKLHLYKSPRRKLDLSLPVRYVFSTDIKNWHERGYVFNPEFEYRKTLGKKFSRFFGINLGFTWATEELMDYFYEVEPRFATATRPAYDADGGYLGTNASFFLIQRLTKPLTAFVGVSKNYFSDAKNRSSPLHRDVETESFFLGLNWTLYTQGRAGVGKPNP